MHARALVDCTLSRPALLRQMATSVLGKEQTASLEGRMPACNVTSSTCLLYFHSYRTKEELPCYALDALDHADHRITAVLSMAQPNIQVVAQVAMRQLYSCADIFKRSHYH